MSSGRSVLDVPPRSTFQLPSTPLARTPFPSASVPAELDVSQTMKLQNISFGLPIHNWIPFKISADNGYEFEDRISSVPDDPLIQFEGVIADIKCDTAIRPVTLYLEPPIMTVVHDVGLLTVCIDKKIEFKCEATALDYGYHLAMGLNRLLDACRDYNVAEHWRHELPRIQS